MDDFDWLLSVEKACDWHRIDPGVTGKFFLGHLVYILISDLNQKYINRIFISVVVVSAFFFCWTPFHSQRVMFCLGKTLEKSTYIKRHIGLPSFITKYLLFTYKITKKSPKKGKLFEMCFENLQMKRILQDRNMFSILNSLTTIKVLKSYLQACTGKLVHFSKYLSLSVTLYGGWTKELTAIQHIIFTVSGEDLDFKDKYLVIPFQEFVFSSILLSTPSCILLCRLGKDF